MKTKLLLYQNMGQVTGTLKSIVRVQIPPLLICIFVDLGNLILLGLSFFSLVKWDYNDTYLLQLLGRLSDAYVKYLEHDA